MRDFILSFRVARRNNWIFVYNNSFKMYDAITTDLALRNRTDIDVIKDFRINP